VPMSLFRPLHLSAVPPGTTCPRADAKRVSRNYGPALGAGPVYMVGWPGVVRFPYPNFKGSIFYGSPWGGQKVLWAASSHYHGPVLIRGH